MILVTGTGRSGTTAIADALISMGVDMGPLAEDGTSVEDKMFVQPNRALLSGRRDLDWWTKAITAQRDMGRREPWGFKDPRAATIIGHYWELFYPDILVVWARRNLPDVLRSWAKAYPDEPPEQSRGTAYARFDSLKTWSEISTCNFLTIDMDTHVPPEELVEQLGPFLTQGVT